jgi:hypothetical protein
MKKIIYLVLKIIVVIIFSSSVYSQTETNSSGNWSDPSIWTSGVPNRNVDAVVKHNVSIDVNSEVKNLQINSGSVNNSLNIFSIWGSLSVYSPSSYNETNIAITELRGESTTISGKVYFNRLRLFKNSNSFEVLSNDSLFVKSYLNLLRGTLNVGSKAITLIANSTQEANIGYSVAGSKLLGSIIWQKYLNRCNGYSIYSTPFLATLKEIASSSDGRMIYTGFAGGVDYPNYDWSNTYFYDEALEHVVPSSTDDLVTRGTGFYYWNSDVVSTSATGTSIPQQWLIKLNQKDFNAGSFEFNIDYSSTSPYPGSNLIGNPFPGILNWNNNKWIKENMFDAIYFYNNCLDDFSSYVNGSGTNGADQWIPAGQGFFVEASGPNPKLTCSTEILTLGTAPSKPLKSGQFNEEDLFEESYPYILFSLNESETVIRFSSDATLGFDNGKDAKKFTAPTFVNSSSSSLRTVLNGVNYSINAMPFEELIIPLDVKGEGELVFSGAQDFANLYIYLEDLVTGDIVDLKTNNSYFFKNIKSGFIHRFNILTRFKPLSLSYTNQNSISVYPNPFLDKLIINSSISFNRISIYNLLGDLVFSGSYNSDFNNSINTSDLSIGTYIIKVFNSDIEVGSFLTFKQ